MSFPILHDFGPSHGMTVMQGRRVIATAKKWRSPGAWQLRLYDASWANTMTNEPQKAWYARLGIRPDIAPNLTSVKTYRQAKKIMSDLAGMRWKGKNGNLPCL